MRVFLLEDLRGMRLLLDDLFASMGQYRVVSALSTEAEAKLWLEEHPGGWDVAIVDLVLDEGTGMNVLRALKAAPDAGAVAVFSGYATGGVRQHCMNLGADAVFDKTQTSDFIAWLVQVAQQRGALIDRTSPAATAPTTT
nr:response regulator [Ramlibacter pallidus]